MHASKTILRGCFTSVLSAWTRSKGVTLLLSLSLSARASLPSFLPSSPLPHAFISSLLQSRSWPCIQTSRCAAGWTGLKHKTRNRLRDSHPPTASSLGRDGEIRARLSLTLSLFLLTVELPGSWIIAFVISSLGLWRERGGGGETPRSNIGMDVGYFLILPGFGKGWNARMNGRKFLQQSSRRFKTIF